MITKDGYGIIFTTGVIGIVFVALSLLTNSILLWIISGLVAVLFVFHFFFFRDPDRLVPDKEGLIISPADGKVIKIDEIEESLYFNKKVQRVSIFMSVFDVHINRVPISGVVEKVLYRKGKYLPAFEDSAALENEQNLIAIRSKSGPLAFTQVAGIIARRIVSRLKEGDQVTVGQRFGMIKYSSRVDLFLPESVKVLVQLGQKVKGGSTIIGEFLK